MVAVSAPFGFRAAYHPSGVIRPDAGTIVNTNTTAIFMGDPVSIQTTGVVAQTVSGVNNGLVGIFLGCEFTLPGGIRRVSPFWPGAAGAGATDIVAYYTTDPNIVFEVQADGSVPSTAIGEQATFTLGSGNTSTGISTAVLQTSSLSAATANQLRVVGVSLQPDNAWGDAFTIVRVQIALHQYVNRQGPF
jgi:hypothetical protein